MKHILRIILFLLIASINITGQNILIADHMHRPLENGGYVLLNLKGEVVNSFTNISSLAKPSEGIMAANNEKKLMGYVDAQTGKWLIAPQYDPKNYSEDANFHEGVAIVQRISPDDDNITEYGGIDKTGKPIVPFAEGELSRFSEGLAAKKDPKKGNKYGFIDKTGNWVIPATWEGVGDGFSEGLSVVAKTENGAYKYGYIDKTGKVVLECQWGSAEAFKDGLAAVKKTYDAKTGFIDKTGKMVIQPQFEFVKEPFKEGLAVVSVNNGKTGNAAYDYEALIDKTGKILTKQEFSTVDAFREGLAQVTLLTDKENGTFKTGFIDKTGKVVIPIVHDAPDSYSDFGFKEGLAPIKNGYIDTKGKLAISFPQRGNLSEMKSFQNGVARLTIWNKDDDNPLFRVTLIDKTGKILWQSPENVPTF